MFFSTTISQGVFIVMADTIALLSAVSLFITSVLLVSECCIENVWERSPKW